VCGAVVGDGLFREIVPPLAYRAFLQVRVRVGEEVGIDERFLFAMSADALSLFWAYNERAARTVL
jgi:hypothetical protein